MFGTKKTSPFKAITMTFAAVAALTSVPTGASALQWNELSAAQAAALFGGAVIVGGLLLSDSDSSNSSVTVHHPQPVQPKPRHRPRNQPVQIVKPVQGYHAKRPNPRLVAQSATEQTLRRHAKEIGYRGAQVLSFDEVYRENGRWILTGIFQYNAKAQYPGPKMRFTSHVRRGEVIAAEVSRLRQRKRRHHRYGGNNW